MWYTMKNELLFICRLLSYLIMYFWSEVKSVMIDGEVSLEAEGCDDLPV
jgi:hypothetical protein